MGIDWTLVLLSVVRAQLCAILVLWFKVMYHYGHAAKVEWRQQGGSMRGFLWEFLHPFTWGWRQFASYCGFGKPQEKSAYETYTPYTPGVILRFAIWAAALAPCLAFLRFFTEPYNDPIIVSTLILSVVVFEFSIFGALAHLYVAHRQRPMRWMWIVVLSTLWTFLGPLAFYVFSPEPVVAL